MKRTALPIILCIVFVSLVAKVKIPLAPEKPDTLYVHDTQLIDPWAWMQDRDDPELSTHLRKESKYASHVLKSSRKLAKTLYGEFASATGNEVQSHPYFYRGYYYYSLSPKDSNYPIYYRKQGSLDAPAELILDCNVLAHKKAYFDLGIYAISPDQRYLAYSVDDSGNEDYRLFIRDLSTRQTMDTGITQVSDFIWYQDSLHFLFVKTNDRWQSNTAYLASREDITPRMIFREQDPQYDLSFYASNDKNKIFLLAYSKNATEVYHCPSDDPNAAFKSFSPRISGIIYYPDFFYDRYYIQASIAGSESAIYTCTQSATDKDAWQSFVPTESAQPIETYLLLKDFLIVLGKTQGFDQFKIYDRHNAKYLCGYTPPQSSDLNFWVNPDPQANSFTFSSENALMPYTIYSYDLMSTELTHLYRHPQKIARDLNQYESKVLWVKSSDNRQIPLSLVYKKSSDNAPRPLWLYAYGAYATSEEPYYSETRFSLLDRGVVYAVAHIRGGGELGQNWYLEGKKQHKMNSFTDFIACIDYLVVAKISSYSQILIEGGSAGGLLVGAVANLAPQKCRVVIADVPFVDVLNTMLNPDLPLTVQEYEEWGDPQQKEAFEYIKSYCPYTNVSPQSYPAFLISAGWNDTRVGYWEALKWTQILRKNQKSSAPIVFRLNLNEGHLGTQDHHQSLRQYAQSMAFGLSLILGGR